MVIVCSLRGNIIITALCWIERHNVHSPQHTYVSSSYRSDGLGLSHWDPYAMHRGGCLELYSCNMVEWFWWDSSLISTTNWFPSVLWHCWFGHLACKNLPEMTYYVSCGTLNPTHSHSVRPLKRPVWSFLATKFRNPLNDQLSSIMCFWSIYFRCKTDINVYSSGNTT